MKWINELVYRDLFGKDLLRIFGSILFTRMEDLGEIIKPCWIGCLDLVSCFMHFYSAFHVDVMSVSLALSLLLCVFLIR